MSTKHAYNGPLRNTVHRARQRATYDYKTVHGVFNAASIVHVAFLPTDPVEDPYPTILPMIGTMCSFSDRTVDPDTTALDLYLHGHAASRLMKLPTDHADGLPVCVSASVLDGIVPSFGPFHDSSNYRSAIAHGYATLATDEKERIFALTRMADGLAPRRWSNSGIPPTQGKDCLTTIFRVTVENANVKTRIEGSSDSGKDWKDPEVTGPV